MVDQSGRFRLLKASELMSPAKCVICGVSVATDDGQPLLTGRSDIQELEFVDGRLDFEFYGTVYYCKQCTIEMASMWGSVHVEQFEELNKKYESIMNELSYVLTRNTELEEAKNVLLAELHRLSPVTVVDGVVNVPEVKEFITKEGSDGSSVPEGNGSNQGQGNIETDKLDILEGLDDIFDDSGQFSGI